MLDNDERVPFFAQRGQRFEQPHIIARMQADGRLIEHVKNAAQIRAELRRQANALRFAAAQSFGRTAEREIAEPDIVHESKPLLDFRNQIRPRSSFGCRVNSTCRLVWPRFAGRKRGEIVDRLALHPHVTRDRIQARAVAGRADLRFAFIDPFRFALGGQLVFED